MTPDPNHKIFAVVALFVGLSYPDGEMRILTVSRRGKPDDIGLPGGKVEPGETPEQAIVREIQEEVGLFIDPKDLMPVYDRLDSPTETEKVARTFMVMAWVGAPKALEEGFTVRWASVKEILAPTNTFADYNQGLFEALGFRP